MMLKPLLLIVSLAFLVPSLSMAAPAVNTEDTRAGIVTMDELNESKVLTTAEIKAMKAGEKKQLRMERRMARLEKFMNTKMGQKLLEGLNDPVDRFFWYWIIAWGIGLILILLAAGTSGFGVIGVLATLAWLAGSVSLIVWLVKKFS